MGEFILENYLQLLEESADIEDCPKVPIPPISKNQNYLFISYSHKDYKKVYSDLAHLYCHNVRFWYDKGLSAGKDWELEVQEHIRDSNCCGIIFYISTNMFLSSSILKEIEFTRKRKRSNMIVQKNYFCVNLHKGNITDILFDAQNFQKSNQLPLLDTNAVNTLTSTFSDNATYIPYSSKYHLEELVEKIQFQFNVTNQEYSSNHPFGQCVVNTQKEAVRTFCKEGISIVMLLKYLHAVYRESQMKRPWYLLPISMIANAVTTGGILLKVLHMQGAPFLDVITQTYSVAVFIWLTILLACGYSTYMILKLFWLFYLTPVYNKREKSFLDRLIHDCLFLCSSVLTGPFAVSSAILLYLLFPAAAEVLSTVTGLFQKYR